MYVNITPEIIDLHNTFLEILRDQGTILACSPFWVEDRYLGDASNYILKYPVIPGTRLK